MIKGENDFYLRDPVDYNESKLPKNFKENALSGKLVIYIPKHLKENQDRKTYKAGFLNELYLTMNPGIQKKELHEFLNTAYDLFVNLRQFKEIIKKYNKEKYSKFVLK